MYVRRSTQSTNKNFIQRLNVVRLAKISDSDGNVCSLACCNIRCNLSIRIVIIQRSFNVPKRVGNKRDGKDLRANELALLPRRLCSPKDEHDG